MTGRGMSVCLLVGPPGSPSSYSVCDGMRVVLEWREGGARVVLEWCSGGARVALG